MPRVADDVDAYDDGHDDTDSDDNSDNIDNGDDRVAMQLGMQRWTLKTMITIDGDAYSKDEDRGSQLKVDGGQ